MTPNKSGTTRKAEFLASQSGEQISRAARVDELRQLVASGRYHVEPTALAERMLQRALRSSRTSRRD